MKISEKIKIDPEFKSLIPPLTIEERNGLEANLVAEGCREALVVWKETGILLDGHNRFDLCESHGIDFRTTEISLPDRTSAKVWIIKNQFSRRNISDFTRGSLKLKLKPLIEEQAKANQRIRKGKQPGSTLPNSGELSSVSTKDELDALPGPKHDTLNKIEKVLESGSEKLIEAAELGTISTNAAADIAELTPAEQNEVIEKGRGSILATAKEIKRKRATDRVARRIAKKAAAVKKNHPLKGKSFELICGDIGKVNIDIKSDSVDAIITDPPYPEEYLHLYGVLASTAARVLRPGGHCLVMVGQSHLPQVMNLLCAEECLAYQWTLAYFTPGESTQVFGRRVKSNWKPVIWLVKGKFDWEHVEDTVRSDMNDKRFHEWGQSVGGMAQLVERFTVKKSLILDPFVGGGSTAIAAISLDRLFLGIDIDRACIQQTAERIQKLN